MILQHPTNGEKINLRRDSPLRYELLKQGYRDVTPPRTPAQLATTTKWLARGKLELALANLKAVINDQQFYQFTPQEWSQLRLARDIIQAKSSSYPMSIATHKRLRKEAESQSPEQEN